MREKILEVCDGSRPAADILIHLITSIAAIHKKWPLEKETSHHLWIETSYIKLAKKTGYSDRTVMRAVDFLIKRGYIRVHIVEGYANLYQVCSKNIDDWRKRRNSSECNDSKISQATRLRIATRDGFKCRYCGKNAITVDHVIPRSQNGVNSDSNLVTCCVTCNSKKRGKTPQQAGMKLLEVPS